MMRAGELSRPNLGKVSSLLQGEFGRRQAAAQSQQR
jgi:hypothetical protein